MVNLSGTESCFLPTFTANRSLDFGHLFSHSSITPLSHRPTRGPKFASEKASPRPFCFGQAGLEGDICVGIAWGLRGDEKIIYTLCGAGMGLPTQGFAEWGAPHTIPTQDFPSGDCVGRIYVIE